MYFAAVNAKGGVKAGDGKTYKLELIKEDDGYDPAQTPALGQEAGRAGQGVRPGRRHRHRDQPGRPRLPQRELRADDRAGHRLAPQWGNANAVPVVHRRPAVLRDRGPRLPRLPRRRASPTPRSPCSTRTTTSARRTRPPSRSTSRRTEHHDRRRAELQPAVRRHHRGGRDHAGAVGRRRVHRRHRRHAVPQDADVHPRPLDAADLRLDHLLGQDGPVASPAARTRACTRPRPPRPGRPGRPVQPEGPAVLHRPRRAAVGPDAGQIEGGIVSAGWGFGAAVRQGARGRPRRSTGRRS